VRDAIVDQLVARSKRTAERGPSASPGCSSPAYAGPAWPLVQACPGKGADIEAETLAAFLAAVAGCQPGRARLASRLCWLARTGAQRLLRAELSEQARVGTDPVSAAPPRPWATPTWCWTRR